MGTANEFGGFHIDRTVLLNASTATGVGTWIVGGQYGRITVSVTGMGSGDAVNVQSANVTATAAAGYTQVAITADGVYTVDAGAARYRATRTGATGGGTITMTMIAQRGW
jgi:hypothetical protein